jgi:hypothetical protein
MKATEGHDVSADKAAVEERGNSLLSLYQCGSNAVRRLTQSACYLADAWREVDLVGPCRLIC